MHLAMSPLEFMQRLAALVPWPALHSRLANLSVPISHWSPSGETILQLIPARGRPLQQLETSRSPSSPPGRVCEVTNGRCVDAKREEPGLSIGQLWRNSSGGFGSGTADYRGRKESLANLHPVGHGRVTGDEGAAVDRGRLHRTTGDCDSRRSGQRSPVSGISLVLPFGLAPARTADRQGKPALHAPSPAAPSPVRSSECGKERLGLSQPRAGAPR